MTPNIPTREEVKEAIANLKHIKVWAEYWDKTLIDTIDTALSVLRLLASTQETLAKIVVKHGHLLTEKELKDIDSLVTDEGEPK